MDNLESSFHADMLNIYSESSKLGYKPTYLQQMIYEMGGLAAAKQLINKDGVTEGYIRLWELKRLDLSVENLVLNNKYQNLFTEEERAICTKRLKEYKYLS